MELDYLNLFLVLLVAWGCGMAATRLGYPSVLGELIGGIVFGPTLLGWLEVSQPLRVLAEVGVLLLMLYIGMELDPAELGRASWAGLLAAAGGFAVPFVLCFAAVRYFGGAPMAAMIVALAAAGTSLAIKSRILVDLKLLDTRVAHAMMAAALITDTVLLIVFAGTLGVVDTGQLNAHSLGVVTLKALAFFAVTALLGLFVFPFVGRRLAAAGLTSRTFNFSLVLILAVGFGELARASGLHAIVGSFVAGIFLRDNVLGRTLSRDLMGAVHEVSIGFLAPIFFVTAGFAVSRETFTSGAGLAPLLAVVGLAIVGKIGGTVVFYVFSGNGWREGLAVATGMNGRGTVEIIIGGIALERGLISPELFSMIVVMVIFTTITVPILLKWTTDWLRRRGELVRSDQRRSGVLILGAGPTARALAQLLGASRDVALIDNNPERCEAAAALDLKAMCGNALQEQVLADAGAGRMQTLIAMTPNPEVNALVAQTARSVFFVPEILALQRGRAKPQRRRWRKPPDTLAHLHASTLFGGPTDLSLWDRLLEGEEAHQAVIDVEAATEPERFYDGLQQEAPTLPLAIERGGEQLVFHSAHKLLAGDRVIVLRPGAAPEPVQHSAQPSLAQPMQQPAGSTPADEPVSPVRPAQLIEA